MTLQNIKDSTGSVAALHEWSYMLGQQHALEEVANVLGQGVGADQLQEYCDEVLYPACEELSKLNPSDRVPRNDPPPMAVYFGLCDEDGNTPIDQIVQTQEAILTQLATLASEVEKLKAAT